MAQGFKLVLRPSKPGEKDSEKKFYAVSKTNGTSSMKTLCKLISARSTVSSADVKAVLDNLNFVLDMELQEGRIVRLGDFGSFRISVSSDGVTDKKDFNTSMLQKKSGLIMVVVVSMVYWHTQGSPKMAPLRRLVALIAIARMRFNVQLVMAVLLCVTGLTLVFCGFWVAPSGEIDNSVLVAFGEICTFAGALFGVDYSYKLKIKD